MAMRFNGMEVVVHRSTIVRRSWRERLFTRPWRPLQATRVVPSPVPPRACYIIAGRIIMGEEAYDDFRKIAKPTTAHERNRSHL